MNENISSYYTNELNKMADIQNSIIEHLRKDLINMGEQSFLYDDDDPVVPIYYLNDDNDENGKLDVDKIKADSKGVIKIHDKYDDEWYSLTMLDNQAANALIEYIDWK